MRFPHVVALTALLAIGAGCEDEHATGRRFQDKGAATAAAAQEQAAEEKIEVPPPPFTEGIFPCTECHEAELPVNTKKRQLNMAHKEIVLRHDEEHRWCLDCHSAQSRDKLHLANGELIDFTESYRLCGQCHGDKYRDWKAGVHGRRSGSWNGQKTYLLCVHCHNAHAPAFQPIAPMPVPHKPVRTE